MPLIILSKPFLEPGKVILKSKLLYNDYLDLIQEFRRGYLKIFGSFDSKLKPVVTVKLEYVTDFDIDHSTKTINIDITRFTSQLQIFSSNYVLCSVYYVGGKYVYGIENVLELIEIPEHLIEKAKIICELAAKHCEICGIRLLEDLKEKPVWKIEFNKSKVYICDNCYNYLNSILPNIKNIEDDLKISRLSQLLRIQNIQDLLKILKENCFRIEI